MPGRRRPLWAHDDDGYTHTAVTAGGVVLRCYGGVWCAKTRSAEGWWRSAIWMGVTTPTELSFINPVAHDPTSALPGQEALFE